MHGAGGRRRADFPLRQPRSRAGRRNPFILIFFLSLLFLVGFYTFSRRPAGLDRRRAPAQSRRPSRAGGAGRPAGSAMRCLALLGLVAWGLGSWAGHSGGASPSPCPAPCSCDGDRGVDCSGRGLAAVPPGLSAFTHAL